MTTETKPDNTIEKTENSNPEIEDQAAKNKAVFGPLGTYAVIAVIMVSVIVTTAIMMNKELGSVEGTIASIEDEVSQMASTDAAAAVSEDESATAAVSADVAAADVTATPGEAAPAIVLSAEITTTPETDAVAETSAQTAISDTAAITQPENAVFRASPEVRQEQLAAEFQARIEAHKIEQKQRMTEMFARIKEQEAQQLDQYKSYQDAQVERLRDQIAAQQQVIDTLISRNKELYDLRAANVQQHQSKRDEMINRI